MTTMTTLLTLETYLGTWGITVTIITTLLTPKMLVTLQEYRAVVLLYHPKTLNAANARNKWDIALWMTTIRILFTPCSYMSET